MYGETKFAQLLRERFSNLFFIARLAIDLNQLQEVVNKALGINQTHRNTS